MTPGQNKRFADQWSPMHVMVGAAFRLFGVSLPVTLLAHTTHEVAEQVFERSEFGRRFFRISGPENLLNSAGDLSMAALGWFAMDRLAKWGGYGR